MMGTTTMSATTDHAVPVLSLSPEIRLAIYKEYLSDTQATLLLDHVGRKKPSANQRDNIQVRLKQVQRQIERGRLYWPTYLALLLTCRKFYVEATPLVKDHVRFSVDIGSPTIYDFRAFQTFPRVRHLVLPSPYSWCRRGGRHRYGDRQAGSSRDDFCEMVSRCFGSDFKFDSIFFKDSRCCADECSKQAPSLNFSREILWSYSQPLSRKVSKKKTKRILGSVIHSFEGSTQSI